MYVTGTYTLRNIGKGIKKHTWDTSRIVPELLIYRYLGPRGTETLEREAAKVKGTRLQTQ